eukprot:1988326-Pleurochrysis_carterae.AAC.3
MRRSTGVLGLQSRGGAAVWFKSVGGSEASISRCSSPCVLSGVWLEAGTRACLRFELGGLAQRESRAPSRVASVRYAL